MTLNTSEVRQKRKKSPFICLMSRSDLVSFQWKSKDSLKGWNWMQWNICQAWFVVLLSVTHTFDPTCVFLVTDAQHTHFQLFVQWQHSSDYSSIWLEQLLRLTHTFIQPQLHQRKEADHNRSVCPHTDCSQTNWNICCTLLWWRCGWFCDCCDVSSIHTAFIRPSRGWKCTWSRTENRRRSITSSSRRSRDLIPASE